ncbi:MAG: hypothetical protein HY688_02395, partial [Chloroflexi bacterium]|nr:hypothetical protein [Chloroflexota bacterium]
MMADEKGILVLGEVTPGGELRRITAELLTAARSLAAQLGGEEVAVALIGEGVAAHAQQAIALGADKVFLVDGPLFLHYLNETFVPAAEAVVRRANPRIVLGGHTPNGRDLGPSLAFRLGTAVSPDTVEFSIDPQTRRLHAVRSIQGGQFRQVVAFNRMPQMATVHMRAYDTAQPDSARRGEIIPVDPGVDPL